MDVVVAHINRKTVCVGGHAFDFCAFVVNCAQLDNQCVWWLHCGDALLPTNTFHLVYIWWLIAHLPCGAVNIAYCCA